MKKMKKKIEKKVFSLDIETSTTMDNNGNNVSFMYLCGVGSCDITKINLENYDNTYNFEIFRTYEQVDKFLFDLNNQNLENDTYSIILIQNAEYEYSFFKRNLKFFCEKILTTNNDQNLTIWSGTQSFKILQIENLIFLDTYVLSNLSLEKIGTQVGVKKLKELKTYKEIYTPYSNLPKNEIDYNYNDCLIPLVFYAKKLKETFGDKIYHPTEKNFLSWDILKMFTQTNANKNYCKNNELININYQYINKQEKTITSSLYKQLTHNFKDDSIIDCDINQKFLKSDGLVKIKKFKKIDRKNKKMYLPKIVNKKMGKSFKPIYLKFPKRYFQVKKGYNIKKLVIKNKNKKYQIKPYEKVKNLASKQGIVLYLQENFQGGFTYANPFFCYKEIENVKSFDATSMYPFVMLTKYFPHKVDTFKENYKNMLETVKNYSSDNFQKQFGLSYESYLDKLQNHTIAKNDFLTIITSYIKNIQSQGLKHFCATIIVRNLKNRILNKKNLISPLSSAKCRWRESNEKNWFNCIHRKGKIELNNGKIKKIGENVELEIKIDSVNMLLLMLFYKFDIISCENLVLFTSNRRSEKYILREIVHFAKIKKELKPLVKLVENEHKKLQEKDIENCSKNVYEQIKNVVDLKTNFEQYDYLNAIYMNSKQNLNGLYGINVQKLCPDNFKVVFDKQNNFIFCKKEMGNYEKNTDKNYIYGMFIPCFARLHLFMFLLFSTIICELDFIYCDTDSVKCKGTQKELEKWSACVGESALKEIKSDSDVDVWLNKNKNKFTFNGLMYQNLNFRNIISINSSIKEIEMHEKMANLGNLGLFENDGYYPKFATMGAKSYIYETKENEIHCTISGINKKKVSDAFTEYKKTYELTFSELIYDIYSPNIVFDNSIADKKYHCYYNDYFFQNLLIIDENGKKWEVSGYSGIVLEDIDVEIHTIDEKMTSSLVHFVLSKTLQDKTLTYEDIKKIIPKKRKLYRSNIDKKLYLTDDIEKFTNEKFISPFIEDCK